MLEVINVQLPDVITQIASAIADVSEVTMQDILKATAKYYDVMVDSVKGKRRNEEFVKARRMYSYLSCLLTNHTLWEIGEEIGKDHCTVLHHKNKIIYWLSMPCYVNKTQREINTIREGLIV